MADDFTKQLARTSLGDYRAKIGFNRSRYGNGSGLTLGLGVLPDTNDVQRSDLNPFGVADNGLTYDPSLPLIRTFPHKPYFSFTPTTAVSTSANPTVPGGTSAMQPPPDTGGVSDDGSGEWKPKTLPSWAKGLMLGAGIAGLRGGRGANSVPLQMLTSMAQAWKQKQADDEARAKQQEDWKFQQEYRKWWLEQRKAGKLNGNDAGSPPGG